MFKFMALWLVVSSPLAYSSTLGVVDAHYAYDELSPFKAIREQLQGLGGFSPKRDPVMKVEKTDVPQKMTRGQQLIAEAKAKNRLLIAENKKEDTVSDKSTSSDFDLNTLKKQDHQIRQAWKREVIEQRKLWQKEQEIFLGRLKVYQENTFVIPAPVEKIVEKPIVSQIPDAHVVNQSMHLPIRDQFARPTCSAFAGVRALEIISLQNNFSFDLSEQYFYWASKPNCHKGPCSEKGSWVVHALDYSQKNVTIDIPLEANCSYRAQGVDKNETQVPLEASCSQGSVKVVSYERVNTLSDVVETLKKNTPVIMAAKLSENFYKNQGLVTLADSIKSSGKKLDGHALGHAFLAIGFMEMPEKLKPSEGQYCILVANSWGVGWGAGGYACLSEKWLTQYRQPSPFVAITRIMAKK